MKILVADGVSPKGIEILQKAGFETVIKDKLPAEELLEIIPDFDGLIVRSASKVTKEVIERAKKLKIVGRAGVGTDNIDINAATAHGIMVINSPGGNTIAATEHTMGMMMAMANMMVNTIRAIRLDLENSEGKSLTVNRTVRPNMTREKRNSEPRM